MSVGVFQIEIRVNDLAAANEFYRNTFAWGLYQASPSYTLVDTGLLPVVGLMVDQRLPLGVAPLMLVSDCEAAVEKARELGGRVRYTRSEVAGAGAFTAAHDPWGNEIFFWQQFVEGTPKLKHEAVNPFSFIEISTPNLEKAQAYYSALMGWSFWNVPFTPSYAVSEGNGLKRGIGLYGGGSTNGIVSYIEVANVDEIAQKIEANGGTVVVPPEPFLNEGRYIIFADPSGNRLGAIEPARAT